MNELWLGIAGMTLILFAFLMNQIGKWKADFLVYDAVNFVGGLLMVIYAFFIKSYPFLALNAVWTIVSLVDVFSDYRKTKKRKVHLHHKRK